jgi:Fe-S-cluster-containing hydrogenase component 2
MTTFNTGAYPPGCSQRDVDMAAQDPYGFVPHCSHCDDEGCLECCPEEPVTLDDLDQIDAEIAENDAAQVFD